MRDYFTKSEYQLLCKFLIGIYKDNDNIPKFRGYFLNEELHYTIRFLIGSFLRVSDLKVLKWKHIEVRENKIEKAKGKPCRYLYLTHPETKHHAYPVNTMFGCDRDIELLKQYRKNNRVNNKQYLNGDDYVFFPHINEKESTNDNPRDYARQILTGQFNMLIKLFKRKYPKYSNKNWVPYSLRHSAIMYRLVDSKGNIDLMTLARNCRTSFQQIDEFYGKFYYPEYKVENLQSFGDKP